MPLPVETLLLVHQYTFTVYALDVAELALPADGKLNIEVVQRQMQEHILASASWSGVYTLTPRLAAGLAI